MIKHRRLPCSGIVARLTVLAEVPSHMVWTRRLLEVELMTCNAFDRLRSKDIGISINIMMPINKMGTVRANLFERFLIRLIALPMAAMPNVNILAGIKRSVRGPGQNVNDEINFAIGMSHTVHHP